MALTVMRTGLKTRPNSGAMATAMARWTRMPRAATAEAPLPAPQSHLQRSGVQQRRGLGSPCTATLFVLDVGARWPHTSVIRDVRYALDHLTSSQERSPDAAHQILPLFLTGTGHMNA
mmetsp:Transcript_17082/g.25295  ORF Transcript_17082/g.25295 Transcript_17082/m.25295 type:complete len:118 (+) Transcript_17082:32-385(+)